MAKKITRRLFFVLAGSTTLLAFLSFIDQATARPRVAVVAGWTRFRRWYYKMEPRWSDHSDTVYSRRNHFGGRDQVRFFRQLRWRELRWPDNDELVTKTIPEVNEGEVPHDHPMAQLRSHSLPGDPSLPLAERIELGAKEFERRWVYDCNHPERKLEYPCPLQRDDASDEEVERYRWLADCYRTSLIGRKQAKRQLTKEELSFILGDLETESEFDPGSVDLGPFICFPNSTV